MGFLFDDSEETDGIKGITSRLLKDCENWSEDIFNMSLGR